MTQEDIQYEYDAEAARLEFDNGMDRLQAEAWARRMILDKYGVEIC